MIGRIKEYFLEGFPPHGAFASGLKGWYDYTVRLFEVKPPGLARLMRLQPLIALATGFAFMFLLRRGFGYIPYIAMFVLFAFIYITARLYFIKGTAGTMVSKISDLAVLYVINDMLFFVVPFYFESMTFVSINMLFAPVLAGLLVTANWYTLYERWVLRSPVRGSLFYALSFFCFLNFIFPVIFGIRNIRSLAISLVIAGITAGLLLYPAVPVAKNRTSRLKFIGGAVIVLTVLWFGRSIIPPSPLKMTMATACTEIARYRPVVPFTVMRGEEIGDVYFYSSIFAPRGLSEQIEHIWYHEGRKLFTVRLSEIRGGRREGFGTWSRHTIAEGPGKYTVQVWTAGGQMLGKKSFIIR